MPIISSTTTLGSVSGLNSFLFTSDASSYHTSSVFPSLLNYSNFSRHSHKCKKKFYSPFQTPKVSLSGNPKTEQPASANANADATQLLDDSPESVLRQTRVCVCVCVLFLFLNIYSQSVFLILMMIHYGIILYFLFYILFWLMNEKN